MKKLLNSKNFEKNTIYLQGVAIFFGVDHNYDPGYQSKRSVQKLFLFDELDHSAKTAGKNPSFRLEG